MKKNYSNYHRDKEYEENEKLFANIFLKRVKIIDKFSKKKGIVLDVGCSTGVMLDLFKERGWKTWGVEPSKSGKVAKKKGHNIRKDYFERCQLPENHFDLIILNHVLEHMDNPVKSLKKVRRLLKKGGIVLVDVPNVGSLSSIILGDRWPFLLPNEHKYQFTKDSLSNVFKEAGLKVIHFESRSGICEYGEPFKELINSLTTFKKRFFTDTLLSPYSILVTLLNMGDSMSLVGKKK